MSFVIHIEGHGDSNWSADQASEHDGKVLELARALGEELNDLGATNGTFHSDALGDHNLLGEATEPE